MRPARSKTVTEWPARLSSSAAARPAGPDPTTATERPVRTAGGRGVIQPDSQARSAISCSIVLIVTGSPSSPTVHDPSHGAGQTRPVNSGKLLVRAKRTEASRHWPRDTRSFHSGIRLLIGQPDAIPLIRTPVWQ